MAQTHTKQRTKRGNKRNRPHPKMYDYIFERDEGHCAYCGGAGTELEHIVPRTRGGPAIRGNLVLSCRPCNALKGRKFTEEWLTRGFFHVLTKGESLEWLENIATDAGSVIPRTGPGSGGAQRSAAGQRGTRRTHA